MGRRRKLTETVIEKICDAIAIGATNRIAGLYAGVAESSIIGWLKMGREERERIDEGQESNPDLARYLAFLRKYEHAESQAFIGWLQVIDNAAQNNPQWAAYMLERRDRAYSARTELTGADGSNLVKQVVDMSDQEILELLNKLK